MTMNDVAQKEDLRRFFALVLKHVKRLDRVEDLMMDMDLNGMGLDSISALNLMLDLEEAFGVFFPESMFTEETFATPNVLWEALSTLRNR